LAHVASTPNLLVVNIDLPVKTVAELVALRKANPNKLSFGSPGIGSFGARLGRALQVDDRHDR
jgi:tripartite-type tricarboxylate transporter receptor subunit TctC